MNSKQLSIVLGVVVVILLAVVGYMALRDKSQTDTLSQQNTTLNSNGVDSTTNTTQPLSNNNSQSPSTSNNQTATNSTVEQKVYSNTAYNYQFSYPSGLVSISAANREITKPLTDSEVKKLNNLVVGTTGNQDILQVLIVKNQEDTGALFSTHKLNDTTIWNNPTKVTINGIPFSKYVAKNGSYNNTAEAYYYVNDRSAAYGAIYIGLFDKTEGSKILSTFKLTK